MVHLHGRERVGRDVLDQPGGRLLRHLHLRAAQEVASLTHAQIKVNLQHAISHELGLTFVYVLSLLERSASRKQRALKREHDLELGRCPPLNGGVQGVQKVSRMEMLSYKPTAQDDERLR